MTDHPMTDEEIAAIRAIRGRKTIREMARLAAAEAGIPLAELLGPSHRHDLCKVREVVYGAARRHGYSTTQTARIFKRHHTTIISGLRNLDRRNAP